MQEGVERKLLLSLSPGMCGDEAHFVGPFSAEQPANLFNQLLQMLLHLGRHIRVG